MPYYIYEMNEKVEMVVYQNLEAAHKHCQRPPHPAYQYIIYEGDIEKSFDGEHGVPLAMYVNGQRYDVIPHAKKDSNTS